MINRIEILGTVGNVRFSSFEDRRNVNLTVVTNYIYKGRSSNPMMETMWFNVTCWEGKAVSAETLDGLAKGCSVHVWGRLRERTYTLSDGIERHVTEIVANAMELVKDTDAFQPARA